MVSDLTERRLRALLAREQSTARLPSLRAGVVRDGALVWTAGYGAHTGEDARQGTPDLQYRIGSITKTMTAVLVMQLRDEGRLDLADRVEQHVPDAPYGDRTLRDLLSHAAGLPSEPPGPWWERHPGVDFDGLVRRLDGRDAVFPAGATHHYSNVGYGLLGELVGRLRGRPWAELVQERLLRPLGMERTSYHPSPPAAGGYSVHPFAGTLTDEPAHDTGAMAAAGQLWSTVEDLARYACFLLEGDDAVLDRTTLQEMATPQSGTPATGLAGGYGLGLRLVAGGSGTLIGHTGSMPGFLAGLFADPVRRTAAVCLANGTTGLRTEGFPLDLLEELESCEPTVVPAWRPSAQVPAVVEEIMGVWHWGNTAYVFAWDGAQLTAAPLSSGTVTLRFRPQADGTFLGTAGYHHGETLTVERTAEGAASHLECATFVYTRRPYGR